ncbi:MAG: mechanosensitive ion channel, partial [Flavobacteriales bacterium]|nr:mechanosensitive ion channel [Flavobacteriales bacterium]
DDFRKEENDIKSTYDYLKTNHEAYSLQLKSKNVSKKISSIISTLNKQKNYSVKILDKLITTKGKIIPIIDVINNNLNERRTSIIDRDHKSLFNIDYSNKENWDISEITSLVSGEYNKLKTYISSNLLLIFIHFVSIILSISFFVYINSHPINDITAKPTYYKLYFRKLYQNPINLGYVMGLLSFVGIYSNLPLIFIDFYRFLFILPLYFLLKGVTNKKYHIYIYIFIAILISQIIYIFIPEHTIYSRLTLFVVNSLQVFGFVHFLLNIKNNKIFESETLNKVINRIVLIFLIAAVVGFIGNIFGMVMLSEIILKSIFSTLLATVLMTLLLIVSNGMLITYIESDNANKINYLRNNRQQISKVVVRITNFIVFIFLSHFILKNLGLEKVVIDSIYSFVNYEVSLGSMTFSLDGIFSFFFVIWLSLVSSRIIKSLLEEDILPKMEVETGLLHTISMIVKYSIVTMGFFIAMSVAGIPFGQMAIVFSAFGVGIGFGLQNIFNNLVSGFILLFERPIKIGDTVEVGTLIGQVKSIGIRSSKVRTFDGAEIIVPNGNLISNEVINWTLSDRKRRVEIIVGISYNSDPHLAKDIFMEVLKKHPQIVSNPEPDVYFRDLGESSLDFRLLFWTYKDWIKVKSDIIFDVFDALKEAGIEIPFPQQDLHLRSIDSDVEIKHKSTGDRSLNN